MTSHSTIYAHRHDITTLGDLRSSGYTSLSIRDEMRNNLRHKLQNGETPFHGIFGYEHTVIPDIERAILSRHTMILLGLRGQAKTRIARLLVNVLDEWIPYIAGSEIHDDPLAPLSRYALDCITEYGDKTPIAWLHRSQRYIEKLATPDVSIADLIGDVDPIKAASLKLPYSDERVIHFGLIPRSHRSIFVINELPDLQPRIQVALFNILQESDIQIRGFTMRLPLDIALIFTANPEDYTNRGAIVTPLKDRIDSQILTHYPKSPTIAQHITDQEAQPTPEQKEQVYCPSAAKLLVEYIAFEARKSEYVDQKSGVSARLTISAAENLYSAAERRALLTREDHVMVRMSDCIGIIPSITGKVELVYEGEQEGAFTVAQILIGKAIRALFSHYFPNPESFKRNAKNNPYTVVVEWFAAGNSVTFPSDISSQHYTTLLDSIPGLGDIVRRTLPDITDKDYYFMMEFVLHGLAEYSLLSKSLTDINDTAPGFAFGDLLRSMFTMKPDEDWNDNDE
ncbi:MAG: magnesium chelatase [Ignavibacteria bacterium]|nr:magnesium chelatase [Ignavibacteria bacterium]